MVAYELMLIFNPNLGEEKIGQVVSKIEEKIKGWGGEIKKIDKWGSRRLANIFKKTHKLQQGYYVMVYFEAQTSLPADPRAYLKVSEDIVRYSIYKSIEKEEAPLGEIQGVPLEEKKVIAGAPVEEKIIPGAEQGKSIG